MSYREDQFDIKQTPPSTHPLAEFCVQFWSLSHEQNHLVLSNAFDRQ